MSETLSELNNNPPMKTIAAIVNTSVFIVSSYLIMPRGVIVKTHKNSKRLTFYTSFINNFQIGKLKAS